jgi:FkbM family methyltransferase
MKSIIYGTGKYFKENRNKLPENVDIVAYGDSSREKATSYTGIQFEGKDVLMPEEFSKVDYDCVWICTDYHLGHRLFRHLMDVGIDAHRVRFLNRIDAIDEGWSYEGGEKCIISTIGNVRIRERYVTDFDITCEVFVNNAYNLNLPYKESVVIDVGMNVGIASLFLARKDYVRKVYGFEPFKDTYEQAVENFELNDAVIRDKIIPNNFALTDKDETVTVSVNAKESGWRNIFTVDDKKEKTVIKCRDAATVISEIIKENAGMRIILKCDTEGSEFPIFRSLSKSDCLDNIDVVMMEYHSNPQEILDILDGKKFKSFCIGQKKVVGMIYAVK